LRFGAPSEDPLATCVLLGGGCAGGLCYHLFVNPTLYGDPRAFSGGFRWFAVCALIFLSAYLCIHLRASLIKARFLLLLLCFVVMAIVTLRASPQPWIDVWTTRQGAADALRAGFNPYSVAYPNIYGRLAEQFYAPELISHGNIIVYAYPPLSVLFDLPAFAIFGDVRVLSLVAMLVAAWALARALPGVTGELAALFILFQPRTLFVLEQGWTEPLVLAAFAVSLRLALRPVKHVPHWLALGLALGVLAASKQYSPLLIVPLWLAIPAELRLGATLTALALASAVTLPFAFWDPQGFLRSVVRMQILQPFRTDALSLTAFWARRYGVPAFGPLFAFVSAALVLALTLRWRMRAAQALSCAAAAWLPFVLLNKQAFCNYYWLGAGLVCGAAAVQSAREPA
ncbi:MAG: hypothetical protein ACXWLR_06675, partial [Myxococcales bacterium]